MIGIVFTTEEEAKPFLRRYERGRFDGLLEGETYQDESVLVSILGTGKIKATLRTERLLRQYHMDRVIHAGTCSSLTEDREIGTLVAASQVFEGDRVELSAPSYPRMPVEPPMTPAGRVTLVTQDHVVEHESEIGYWQRIADVTDMTGYPVAYVAATHGVACHIVKVVTGHVTDAESPSKARLKAGAKILAEFLLEEVAALARENEGAS